MPVYTVVFIVNIILVDSIYLWLPVAMVGQFDCDSSVQDWLVTPGNRDGGIPFTCGRGRGERGRNLI